MRISTKDEHEYIDTHATIEKQYKQVTKQEFDEFIASYPRHLERDVCGICEPPQSLITIGKSVGGQGQS